MEAGADKQELQLAEGKYALLSPRVTYGRAMRHKIFAMALYTHRGPPASGNAINLKGSPRKEVLT